MISKFADWLWLILAVLFATLWMWTLWRQRQSRAKTPPPSDTSNRRVEAEDLLKAAYALQEKESTVRVQDLAQALDFPETVVRLGMAALLEFGWAEEEAQGDLHLTERGKARARELIRAHRLWERYLVEREGLSLDVVHAEAHHREHDMTPEEIESLDAELGHPAWDPHGHAIPAPDGRLPAIPPHSLLDEGEPGKRLRIIQLDEDPLELLAQLVVLGLTPGVELEVQARESTCLRVLVNGDLVPLANAAARSIFVVPMPALSVPLGELLIGSHARVTEVQGGGKHQRRMLDMGFVPGAEVTVIRKAPLGDPIEYRVKETSVALRKEDASTILVEELRNE